MLATKADFGVAFDGDGDRLAFVDENARFIGCDLMTALFAAKLLSQPGNRGKNVMYDLRSSGVVKEVIEASGGVAEMCRVGHSHVKAAMRGQREGRVLDPKATGEVIFAGELSGHFFFGDCFSVDTSERAFLLALQIVSDDPRPFSQLVAPLGKFWQSGEINYRLQDEAQKKPILDFLEQTYAQHRIFKLDGVSVQSRDWSFNVRFSNTEPLVRLTVESFRNAAELDRLVTEVEAVIVRYGGVRLGR